MEVTSTPTTTAIKTPQTEDEKPPPQTQSSKPLSFTNGVLKRHKHQHYETSSPVVVSYKECLKNHAATLGGHALDGCGEFMPSPSSTTTNPTSLKCAACGCHRNFHRREPEENTYIVEYHRHKLPPAPPTHSRSPNSPSPPPLSTPYYPSAPHMLLALSAGLPAAADNYPAVNVSVATPMPATATATATMLMTGKSDGRKRFRTRFSHEQKEKMHSFSEKLGWKMQKKDEKLVEEFCEELGIGKGILKVWMHNNKHTFGKRDVNGIKNSPDETKTNNHNHSYDYQNNNSSGHGHVAINGSSSSS